MAGVTSRLIRRLSFGSLRLLRFRSLSRLRRGQRRAYLFGGMGDPCLNGALQQTQPPSPAAGRESILAGLGFSFVIRHLALVIRRVYPAGLAPGHYSRKTTPQDNKSKL